MSEALEKTTESISLALPGRLTHTSLELPGDLPYEQWEKVGIKLRAIHGAVQWWIGDWLRYGEHAYGEMYSQALEATGKEYQTLNQAVWVAGAVEISRRRENLSWSHHVEVAGLSPGDQDRFLNEATEKSWTRAELRSAVQKAKMPAVLPLPIGLYDVILADPPWPYDNQIEGWGSTSLHYDNMDLESIKAMRVPAANNATLFLWTTNPFLKDALTVVEAWGFEYKTCMVWVKRNMSRPGIGFYVRGRHELLFICTRGSHVPDQQGKEPIGSVIEADAREHSRKPDEVYGIIEAMYPDRHYLELFARGEKRDGWTTWGMEAG